MSENRKEHDATTTADAAEEEKEEFKIYIGRVPTKFTEDVVKRILVEKLDGEKYDGSEKAVVEKVELIYPHDEEDENGTPRNNNNNNEGYRADRMSNNNNNNNSRDSRRTNKEDRERDPEKEHRGFGFVSFATAEIRDSALKLGTIKGGRKKTSKKLHTMYLRPYVAKTYDDDDDDENADGGNNDSGENDADAAYANTASSSVGRDVCYLWNLNRCPYGDECKFRHVGEGGCIKQEKDLSLAEQKQLRRKRKGKCFVYKKKGVCPKGDNCPFWHDFVPDTQQTGTTGSKDNAGSSATCTVVVPKSEKDCINWKTKGKCRKGDECVYKHDPEVRRKALEKIARKKRAREGADAAESTNNPKRRKEKQPLSVRVFGLNYDTTEADVREFVESRAGHPVKSIVFPRFEDSNRSKGYCGVYFASPKAASAAVEKCDNAELHGRWLRVQTGKSMAVEQWEGLHHN